MTTPRRYFNYNSPYTHPVKQYTSQSKDYISLDMGGAKQQYPAVSPKEKTPGHDNLKYYQNNFKNSNSKAKRWNSYNNYYAQHNNRQSFNQQHYEARYSSEWSRQPSIGNSNEKRFQQPKNYQNHKQDAKPISSYIHASMTEDPWFELTKRLRTIERSQIPLKDASPALNKSPTANSYEGDVEV